MAEDSRVYQYDAFISYRHLPRDKAVAVRLQALLESYRTPKNLTGLHANRIGRVFRDQSELPTSGDLGGDIERALKASRFLIVVCSEATRESAWCMEEIRRFKEICGGSVNRILILLVSGEPGEVFPEELRRERRTVKLADGSMMEESVEIEPLCADVRAETQKHALRLLKTEFLRLAAPILGCGFDTLYRRHQRRRRQRIVTAASAAAAGVLSVLLVISIFAYRTYLSEQSYRSTLAESYTRMGCERAETGASQEALMYYAKALELRPEEAKAAAAGAALLLQDTGWPCFESEEKGALRSGRFARVPYAFAMDGTGTRYLTSSMENEYFLADEEGKTMETLEGVQGKFIASAEDGTCWVFCSEKEITLYYTEDGSQVRLPRPGQLSRGCDPYSVLLDSTLPVALPAGEGRAICAYGGYIRLYEFDGGRAAEVSRIDLADVFPDLAEHNGLMIYNGLWISKKGGIAVVSSGNFAVVLRTRDLAVKAVLPNYHAALTGIAISPNEQLVALAYGNSFGIAPQYPGGYFTVFYIGGEEVYRKPFDSAEPISGVAFDPQDSSHLLSWGAGIVRFWDLAAGKEFCAPVETAAAASAAFDGDGLCIVDTGSGSVSRYSMLKPVFQAAADKLELLPEEEPEAVALPDAETEVNAAAEGLDGLIVAYDYFNCYLMDGEGQVLDSRHFPDFVESMCLTADKRWVYLYYPSKNYLYRAPVDYNNKSLGSVETLELNGYTVSDLWPVSGQMAVSTADNHLLLFTPERAEPQQVLALRSAGHLSAVTSDNEGNYLAATLRVIEADEGSVHYRTYDVLELWDVRTGLHIFDFGDGGHLIDRAGFTGGGRLVYESNGRKVCRQILTDAPDDQAVRFLQALSCCDLDENQNEVRKVPLDSGRDPGNWGRYVAAWENGKLPEKSGAAEDDRETLSDAEQALISDVTIVGREELAAAYDKILDRLIDGELQYDPGSVDIFFYGFITAAGRADQYKTLEKGVLAYIAYMEEFMEAEEGDFTWVQVSFYPAPLMAAMQYPLYSILLDLKIEQALLKWAAFLDGLPGNDVDKSSWTAAAVCCRMYAALIRGEVDSAFEEVNEWTASYPELSILFQEEMSLKLLASGNGEAAAESDNAWIAMAKQVDMGAEIIRFSLQFQLMDFYVASARGWCEPETLEAYLSLLDLDAGIEIECLNAEGLAAGFQIGDLITAVNGLHMASDHQLPISSQISRNIENSFSSFGEETAASEEKQWNLTVLRDGQTLTLTVGQSAMDNGFEGSFTVRLRN